MISPLVEAAIILLFCVLGRGSVFLPFPPAVCTESLRWQHLPAWRGGSGPLGFASTCFSLPAAEVVLAGAWLVILSEISFRLRLMMAKKKLIFFLIGFLLFPEDLMSF